MVGCLVAWGPGWARCRAGCGGGQGWLCGGKQVGRCGCACTPAFGRAEPTFATMRLSRRWGTRVRGSTKLWATLPEVTMDMRSTVVGVTTFSLTRKSTTMTMKTTMFSPQPISPLRMPPRQAAAQRIAFREGEDRHAVMPQGSGLMAGEEQNESQAGDHRREGDAPHLRREDGDEQRRAEHPAEDAAATGPGEHAGFDRDFW